MTKTIPRNDSSKQLNEIYHVKDPLNSPPRNRLRDMLQHFELLGNHSFVKNEYIYDK